MKTDVESKLHARKQSSIHRPTQLMGILNVTPDSFYDGGAYFKIENALARARTLAAEGADWIDVGAESTRPGATPVSEEEELRRLFPLLQELRAELPTPLSIDTRRPRVAARALEAGVSMVNDIEGGADPEMRRLIASSGLPLCVMHMQGTPATMQENPSYPRGVVTEVVEWFSRRIDLLLRDGIDASQILLDPGIGFGKRPLDNLLLLANLEALQSLGFPLLIGLSRKSFMGKIFQKRPQELLSITAALNTLNIVKGVHILRIHDVREHRELLERIFS